MGMSTVSIHFLSKCRSQVLRNISGPLNLKTKRYNAAQPLRSQDREKVDRRPGSQPYDFMTFSSKSFSTTTSQPAKLQRLDDLNSAALSELACNGLVLWEPPEQVKVEKSARVIKTASQMSEHRIPRYEANNERDEEAVENMLASSDEHE